MMRRNQKKRARIGIFGGTFDPPHLGHLIIAEQARAQLGLTKVFFVPAFVSPHKRRGLTTSPALRMTMVRRAIQGNKDFAVSDVEVKRKGVSFTIDTLRQFRRRFPRSAIFLIVGADNLAEFSAWKDPGEIFSIATVAFYQRGGLALKGQRKKWVRPAVKITGPQIDISSSEIRVLRKYGRSIRYLVPREVERVIRRFRLYRSDRP